MSDIFISYAREDLDRLRSRAQTLSERGWSVFWDRTIPAGKTWRQFIGKALEEAKCVLVVWSHTSITSEWVIEEADEGRERGVLIPVRIDDVRPPLGFRSIQGVDLFNPELGSPTREFEKLVEDISAIIGPPAEKSGKKKPSSKSAEVQAPTPQPVEKNLEPGTVFRDTLQDGSQGPEMVVIPPGQFKMGDLWGDGGEFDKPVHPVHIPKPFALGRYPVTFDEYETFAAATGGELPGDAEWGRGRRPVINVSWEDAVAYAAWFSKQTGKRYRLPSEAEWEYACRAGTVDAFYWGSEMDYDYCCYLDGSGDSTSIVGQRIPNAWGLYDMSGNVSEWCQDTWKWGGYCDASADGDPWLGEGDSRIARGGSWFPSDIEENSVFDCRSGDRKAYEAAVGCFTIGFRVARSDR